MKPLYLLFLIILISFNTFSQTNSIKGVLIDSTNNNKIINVSVLIRNQNKGTITNYLGAFKLEGINLPCELEITHVAFQTKIITINKPTDNLQIKLSQKLNTLPEFKVNANNQIDLTKDKKLYVWDYTLQNSYLILLAFKNKNIIHPMIYILNENGDSLYSTSCKSPDKFQTDCFNNNHLLTKDEAFQFYYDTKEIKFNQPYNIEKFHYSIDPFVAGLKNHLFYCNYGCNNQILEYIDVDTVKKTNKRFSVAADTTGLIMLRNKIRIQNKAGNYTKANAEKIKSENIEGGFISLQLYRFT